ncbi:MAG: NfeD family protein [Pseudomonadota bacterium]
MELLQNMVFWHWWVVALAFVILEVFIPGAVLIWFGAAAAVVGLLLFAVPDMGWELQFALWGFLSISSAIIARKYLKTNPIKTMSPNLNKRGAQYVGRVFTLEEPVENGYGKIVVDDSTWKIRADEDFKKGTKVRVTDVDGTMLIAEKAD